MSSIATTLNPGLSTQSICILDCSHLPFTSTSFRLHVGGGGHDGSSGFLIQSTGGHDIPIAPGIHGCVGHDESLGLVVQSTGCGLQDESLGLILQSTGPDIASHDGSFGVVLQSIGPGGGGGDSGSGGGDGTVELEHSGAVDPCSHVAAS